MTPTEYWQGGYGLSHITPRGQHWPEGDGFAAFLSGLVGNSFVLEIGCGIGRLAALFSPQRYIGVDICPAAVAMASAALPEHCFGLIGENTDLPTVETTLLYTVLLHIEDEALEGMINRITGPRVLVGEILGRHWRRPGHPPVFNREVSDYEKAFAPRYRLSRHLLHPYPHYRNTDVSILEFTECAAC